MNLRLKVLDRYVLIQVLWGITFGTLMFTVLFVSTSLIFQTIKLLVNYKVGLKTALEFFIYSTPQALAYSLPMGALLGVLLVFNRLSVDNELTAMRTHGIPFIRVIYPLVLISAMLSAFNLWFYNFVVPDSLYRARLILIRAKKKIGSEVVRGTSFSFKTNAGYTRKVNAEYWDSGRMTLYKVTVTDWYKGDIKRLMVADEASYSPEEGTWLLKDVTAFNFKGKKMVSKMKSSSMSLELVPPERISVSRKLEELTLPQLISEISLVRRAGVRPTEMEVELQTRLAIPLAVLIFSIFATALAIQPIRSSSSSGAGLSLLFTLLYYILFYLGKSLSLMGKLPPIIGIWLANVVFLAAGGYMILRVNST